MPKSKNLTPLSAVERDIKNSTEELYQNTPAARPPARDDDAGRAARPPRRRPTSTIPRRNGKLIFFEERHNEAVENIHWQSKADRQDVVRAALDDFLSRHMRDGALSDEGVDIIRRYVSRTRA